MEILREKINEMVQGLEPDGLLIDIYFLADIIIDPTEENLRKLADVFVSENINVDYFVDVVFKMKKTLIDYGISSEQAESYSQNMLKTFIYHYSQIQTEIVKNQQMTIEELSTPVVELWDKIIALPIIGVLDSHRVRNMMEELLNKSVQNSAKVVILDITGVNIVDTETANYLIKTAKAVKLMGVEAIITGISPQIAQTIVNLGIDFGNIKTLSTLKGGLETALKMCGFEIKRNI